MTPRPARSKGKKRRPAVSPPPNRSDDAGGAPSAEAPEGPDQLPVTCPFGPAFFRSQLGVFVRDRCPNPSEHLPAVEIHLTDGEVLNVCHVIHLAATWFALAVDDRETVGVASMRTEVVAYEKIARVTIRSILASGDRVGFSLSVRPHVA